MNTILETNSSGNWNHDILLDFVWFLSKMEIVEAGRKSIPESYIGNERRSKVATQGSNNGHERNETENKTQREGEGRNIREYRAKDTRPGGGNRTGRDNQDRRPRDNQNNGEYRRRDSRGGNERDGRDRDGRSSSGEYRSRENRSGGYKPRENRSSYGGYQNYGKDEDEGKKVYRSAKPRQADKGKEPQPDKFETIKRLEREQKTIKKKESKRNKTESARPQQKVKRQNNRNYKNDYENGMYDDYEDDF